MVQIRITSKAIWSAFNLTKLKIYRVYEFIYINQTHWISSDRVHLYVITIKFHQILIKPDICAPMLTSNTPALM